MKICSIVGARPQFVKYFPVSRAIRQLKETQGSVIEDILVHSGQHYDYNMSKIFFDAFDMKSPDFHLEVGSGSHGRQTSDIIRRSEEVLLQSRPDFVLVYGDTNTTLGAALAAAKLNVPVAHIEAGLRSFNRRMPEEINRIATDHISNLLFCPCQNAVDLLKKEGFDQIINSGNLVDREPAYRDASGRKINRGHPVVVNTGDVMYDVLMFVKDKVSQNSHILDSLNLKTGEYGLLTLHRAENTDDSHEFTKIVDFINSEAQNLKLIFPIHPRTKKLMNQSSVSFSENVRIIDPVHYFDLIALMMHSRLLLTDSGGMQKEAYWLKVPCVTLREETEWPETVTSGWNVLYQDYTGKHTPASDARQEYGDGFAASRIVRFVENWEKLRQEI